MNNIDNINNIDNNIDNLDNINNINNICNNDLISYINNFYKIYPYFDILFYKKILHIRSYIFHNELDYYMNYSKNNEIHLSCFEEFNKFYKIDYNFLKDFYSDFSSKKNYIIFNEIVKYIDVIENINIKNKYILSLDHFNFIYKDFDIFFYKKLLKNNEIFFETDKEYMYYLHYNDNYKIYSKETFYQFYKDFDENIALCSSCFINKSDFDMFIFHNFMCKYEKLSSRCDNNFIIYSVHGFYEIYPDFNKDIYIHLNKIEEYNDNFENNNLSNIIIHFLKHGLKNNFIYSYDKINDCDKNIFSLSLYRAFNANIKELNDKELFEHWIQNVIMNKDNKDKDNQKNNVIYSIKTFLHYYHSDIDIDNTDNEEITEEYILFWLSRNDNRIVNHINEVLIDLAKGKKELTNGISLIIRAKNEEPNIKLCIESVVDLVDEIIFVDNNSTDNTYRLMKVYEKKFKNIKVYKYNIQVSKVGIEHKDAIQNGNKNTLGTFYNWCLSKATKYNVFKWDADFICVRNNFTQLVNTYNLRSRNDKFAIWFSGKTVFEDNGNYYINYNSYYNEFRIFSYKNGFCWYDGEICEYTEPYLQKCSIKYKYDFPLFFEIKRTGIDEFMERSSLIDIRDKNDFNILENLKNGKYEKDNHQLININSDYLCKNIGSIIIYTPSFNWGGGNKFIIDMYILLKNIGYTVFLFSADNQKSNLGHYNHCKNDVYDISLFNISFIKHHNPKFILFNSTINFNNTDLYYIYNLSIPKLIFITHSDVAYANYFIKLYYNIFYKIITVNQYTIDKLCNLLKIRVDDNKFYKFINSVNNDKSINNNDKSINNKFLEKIKTKKFGVISRFSEDKNIPMFIYALEHVFKKYPDYKCYLIGCDTEKYDDYLKNLVKKVSLGKNIYFEGYQKDVSKYYKILDFIVLPSVSEGASYNIIEAINYGLPVITSNVGGNHELITDDINGILYEYEGIRDFEKKNIYIHNYNEQLSIIGYFIKDELNNIDYSFNNICKVSNTNVIIPFFINCNKHNIINHSCEICIKIMNKTNIFKKNMNNISLSIIKMIEYDDQKIKDIAKYDNIFVLNNLSQYIYINQTLNILS